MNSLSFSSVNKLSFIVFLVGLCFFCYELYLLFKEKEKKTKPQIPQFNIKDFDKKTIITSTTPIAIKKKERLFLQFNIHLILVIILFIMTVSFFFISMVSLKTNKEKEDNVNTQVTYSETQSKGIKIYSRNFEKELNEQDLTRISSGTEIIIGLETILGADIDRARIKINEKEWAIKHITTLFDTTKKVYYTYYTIATGESNLSIDAQLHSFKDGWLGD